MPWPKIYMHHCLLSDSQRCIWLAVWTHRPQPMHRHMRTADMYAWHTGTAQEMCTAILQDITQGSKRAALLDTHDLMQHCGVEGALLDPSEEPKGPFRQATQQSPRCSVLMVWAHG